MALRQRPGHVKGWIVHLMQKNPDGLPYSKIKAICHKYRQRLLTARVPPSEELYHMPPGAVFLCRPSASYVISAQLTARLSESQMSALRSNLSVYERMAVEKDENENFPVSWRAEELDCTPEVFIDEDLSHGPALYYGDGQIHFVGMLDMHRARMIFKDEFESSLL
ncbi:hypothetical protein N8I77_002985 [Diaporthe amygdali]|uniref:Uncharacterized protein n=1 Tax=Phomopsis amygdali TaxID=1214568 RepID=A0AAD9W6B4_PHOAM|nr:hypothetical protein N8I77_002985 [Diaporthe amygdali]